MCVQAKQPRKSHTTAEARDLAPLELIHSDLCEMNGVLTKGGKKYFMTLIDDSTRYWGAHWNNGVLTLEFWCWAVH